MAEINGKQVLLGCKLNLTLGIFDYDASAIYNKGMAVSYSGDLYTPLEDGVTGISPSSDASKWKRVLDNYLEKAPSSHTQHVHATLKGVETLIPWSTSPVANTFPRRLDNGRIKGGTPIDSDDLTPKKYVDEKIPKLYKHAVSMENTTTYGGITFTGFFTKSTLLSAKEYLLSLTNGNTIIYRPSSVTPSLFGVIGGMDERDAGVFISFYGCPVAGELVSYEHHSVLLNYADYRIYAHKIKQC